MDVIDDLAKANLRHETVLTIGAFDGVHRGHQALIREVVERARAEASPGGVAGGRLAGVVTFHPHPVMVLAPERAPLYLTTPGEKLALFEALDVDVAVVMAFNRQVAALSAREFMTSLVEHLRLRELWVGPDFALGRNREGNVPRLIELGRELGYEVHVIQPIGDTAQPGRGVISSSRIRELLVEGHVEEAAELLGRYPSLSGEVVSGAHRGHQLGFPTANLEVRPERAVPANGIYAVFALLGTECYPGVANVGVRPTFDNGERTVETFIFDFDQDIYGCDLVVEFVARLRDEERFSDISALIAQMHRDSELARKILDEKMQAGGSTGLDARPGDGQPPAALRAPRCLGGEEKQGEGGCRYRYFEIEHTADRALTVWGRSLADLFTAAGRGMASLMADLAYLIPSEWREVRLEAYDRETLLVDWLNELLYLTEVERLLFIEFEIESLTDTALVARAGGAHAPEAHESIKAATFHDLSLVHDGAGWSAVITFDT